MDAGAELDDAIADKIMNKKRLDSSHLFEVEPGADRYATAPPYSTSLVHAWEVVEHLRGKGYSLDVSAYPPSRQWLKTHWNKDLQKDEWKLTDATTFYQCTVYKDLSDCQEWVVLCDAEGDSPAHAICLAALEGLRREKL